MENLGTIILAIGALGTASFGIVEGLKWTIVGLAGFRQIRKLLGEPVMQALHVAYGPEYLSLLKAQYRANRAGGELPKSLRQGARIGLTPDTAEALASRIGVVGKKELKSVAAALEKGKTLSDSERNILGRYELALDTRIDAALALANDRYIGYMRVFASLVSIGIALSVRQWMDGDWLRAVIVGVAAVPVAPIAKDLASAIQSAAKAMQKK